MTLYKWSQTASADATADATINWAEGQAPSSINDSARAMMAATAKYRDDIAGSLVTTGTSTAYLLTSNQGFDTLAHLHGQQITFTPHATNTGTACTLNVDSLTAKPLRLSPGVEVPNATLILGVPYTVTYNNTDGVFYLRNFYNLPWLIPVGAMLDYWGTTSPSSSFVFPNGQTISRSVYSALFNVMGTANGAGDGSTTFQLPDLRGCVVASPDNMGGGDRGLLSGSPLTGGRFSIGTNAGESVHVLATSEMPSHSHTTNVSDPGHAHNYTVVSGSESKPASGGNPAYINTTTATTTSNTTGISVSINVNGGGSSHNNMQPTILAYRILRII